MAWCPTCVWKRIGVDAQDELTGLPGRVCTAFRDILLREELMEFAEFKPSGTIWETTPRGRAVIRAGQELVEQDDEDT